MTDKHTPGPWAYLDIGEVVAGENHEITIAIINDGDASPRGRQSEANGALMAAAPEMLEALQQIVTKFRVYTHEDQAVLNAVRDAIAKAAS